MPFLENSKFLFALRKGYTLIELLVVIAIFGITISIITASYVTFERNSRFRNASTQLKNDIRFVQNKALSGDKSANACLQQGAVLAGWFISVASGSSYTVNSDCRNSAGEEVIDLVKTVQLPRNVTICAISNITGSSGLNVFYQPISPTAYAFTNQATPPFFNTGTANFKVAPVSMPIYIYLSNVTGTCQTSGTYFVSVQSTGEVNEGKL